MSAGIITVVGRFQFDAAALARAIDLARTMSSATRQEPGCIHYAIARDVLDDNVLWLCERWADESALDAHFTTPHMAAFAGGLRALGVTARWARRIDPAREVDLLATPP